MLLLSYCLYGTCRSCHLSCRIFHVLHALALCAQAPRSQQLARVVAEGLRLVFASFILVFAKIFRMPAKTLWVLVYKTIKQYNNQIIK